MLLELGAAKCIPGCHCTYSLPPNYCSFLSVLQGQRWWKESTSFSSRRCIKGALCNWRPLLSLSILCHQPATCSRPQPPPEQKKMAKAKEVAPPVPPKSSKAPAKNQGKYAQENPHEIMLTFHNRCYSEILLIGIQHRSLPRMVLHPNHSSHSSSNPNRTPNRTPSNHKSI